MIRWRMWAGFLRDAMSRWQVFIAFGVKTVSKLERQYYYYYYYFICGARDEVVVAFSVKAAYLANSTLQGYSCGLCMHWYDLPNINNSLVCETFLHFLHGLLSRYHAVFARYFISPDRRVLATKWLLCFHPVNICLILWDLDHVENASATGGPSFVSYVSFFCLRQLPPTVQNMHVFHVKS